jgi:hypothetical protein
MKLPFRSVLVIFALTACAAAQTYTYKSLYAFQPKRKLESPTTSLLIIGNAAYGGTLGGIYKAQEPSSVGLLIGQCCATTAPLIADSSGNLYENIGADSLHKNGAIAEVQGPPWTDHVLYQFSGGDGSIGSLDFGFQGSLLFDASDNLWGVAYGGGPNTCNNGNGNVGCGVAFELTKNGNTWAEQVIHAFSAQMAAARARA